MDFAGGRLLQYLLHIVSANAAARHYLDDARIPQAPESRLQVFR
jgi:hypothetical protein